MSRRRLYHFPQSPFSRRARLALAHKGLDVELIDARSSEEKLAEARSLVPLKTVPVLVEPDGRALGDSGAIARWLDLAYPDAPRIFPLDAGDGRAVLEVTTLVDAALDVVVNTGNRFFSLSDSPAWPTVREEMRDRIQRALDALAARVTKLDRATFAASGWSAAEIWLVTMVVWLQGLPARAPSFPIARQLLTIGWSVPGPLIELVARHSARPDVRSLDG